MSPILFFILCFSLQVHSFPNVFHERYWPSYEAFLYDWRLQPTSTFNIVKTASLPSHISPSFSSLDAGVDRSYYSNVWGLWDHGTGLSHLAYEFNIAERARSDPKYCGMYNVKVAVKFYSESPTEGYIWNCAEQNRGPVGHCILLPSNSGGKPAWTTQTKRVDPSYEDLNLQFYVFNGKPLLIDSVSLEFQQNRTHPSCQKLGL